MDTKITLVPTHTLQSEVQQQEKKSQKPYGYKAYRSQGRYQGYRKKYTSKTSDQKQESVNEQPTPQNTVNQPAEDQTYAAATQQEQTQTYEDSKNTEQYNDYGYEQEGAPQDYKFTCTFARAKDYSTIETIGETFAHLKIVNTNDVVDIDGLTDVRCFIMRSNNEDDIHKAVKYGIWTSTPKSNEFLNNVFEECSQKKIPVFLFYSVVRSGQFVAVAQMTSKIIEKSFQFWWEADKWVNHFQVKWLFVKDITYKFFSHLYMDDDVPVTRARDCTGVPLEVTKEMLRIYRDYTPYNSIFNAFPYMDIREDMLRSYRYSLQAYQQYLANGNTYGGFPSNAPTTQASTQYFKPNTFPPRQKDLSKSNHTQEKISSTKKSPSHNLETLINELEHTLSFYKDQKKQLDKDSEELRNEESKDTESEAGKKPENFGEKQERLQTKEKEIIEGLESMESQHGALIQAAEELKQKVDVKEVKDKFEDRITALAKSLETFKQELNSNAKRL